MRFEHRTQKSGVWPGSDHRAWPGFFEPLNRLGDYRLRLARLTTYARASFGEVAQTLIEAFEHPWIVEAAVVVHHEAGVRASSTSNTGMSSTTG